ncbi:hypothetical protein SASPL_112592 [Salvia splendens]|uniref:Uncharacterized protein n=1 Tax=Salvia splendens TaxID=180675 RepID=A0A8X8YEL1_SALSN|nr:hypothetical protein SASPL_112592 [Salvia splendens]
MPPIDKTSTLVERIVNATNNHDREVQFLQTKYDAVAKDVLDELESLLGKAASVVQTSNDNNREDISSNSVLCIASTEQTANEKDEKCIVQGRPDLAGCVSMMAIVLSLNSVLPQPQVFAGRTGDLLSDVVPAAICRRRHNA